MVVIGPMILVIGAVLMIKSLGARLQPKARRD
jgi:hypothetical protein